MKIGIVGAGRVGVTLGKYLADAGVDVAGYYSKTTKSAVEAAEFTDTKVFEKLADIVQVSDTLFITTPDSVISEVWGCIAAYPLTGKILCHFSGSLSSDIFSGIDKTGASGCSIHPMYAFSNRFTSYENFHTAYLVAEGAASARKPLENLFRGLGHTVLEIRAADKVKYHAAAAMISNDMIALFQTVLDLLEECGFKEEDSICLLRPIIENNVSTMLEQGAMEALTGPVERGDTETVKKHMEALQASPAGEVYRTLGKVLVDIAERKYPERHNTAMQALFSLGEK
ncbi:MAG: DUF2520 domain-containing protein [Lachnospiraceae bacterium]|nr:DUF2520 domain-containing protein [Lachnospiraceae bacterium]